MLSEGQVWTSYIARVFTTFPICSTTLPTCTTYPTEDCPESRSKRFEYPVRAWGDLHMSPIILGKAFLLRTNARRRSRAVGKMCA